MEGLNRAAIVGHERPAPGVTATLFEGGRKGLVNYTDLEQSVDGVKVPARSYLVTGGGQ